MTEEESGSNSEYIGIATAASAPLLPLMLACRNAIIRSAYRKRTRFVHTHTKPISSSSSLAAAAININVSQSEETNAAVKERKTKKKKWNKQQRNKLRTEYKWILL